MSKSPGEGSQGTAPEVATLSEDSSGNRELPEAGYPVRATLRRGRRLSPISIALLLFAVTTAMAGQLMLKHGMQLATAHAGDARGSLAVAAITSPWVLAGLGVFGVSAVAWLATLSRVPLSVAYPFNALGYLGILGASVIFLHERAGIMTWAGSALVVTGLIMVVLAQP